MGCFKYIKRLLLKEKNKSCYINSIYKKNFFFAIIGLVNFILYNNLNRKNISDNILFNYTIVDLVIAIIKEIE